MTDTDTERLARHRRALRSATGLSQAEVVERAKNANHSLSVDTLMTAEAGGPVSERSLRGICLGLECSVATYLTPGSPIVVPESPPATA